MWHTSCIQCSFIMICKTCGLQPCDMSLWQVSFLCGSCSFTWPPKMQVARHCSVCMRLHHVMLQMMIIVISPWGWQLGQAYCLYWPTIFVSLFYLLQVNITLLQASVVEEMISFSALDNIQDLTCVSLFAVCFDAITARFCCSKQVSSLYSFVGSPQVQQINITREWHGIELNTVSCTLTIMDLLCSPSACTFSSIVLIEMLATLPCFKRCWARYLNCTATSA